MLTLRPEAEDSPRTNERKAQVGKHIVGIGNTQEIGVISKGMVVRRLPDRTVNEHHQAAQQGKKCREIDDKALHQAASENLAKKAEPPFRAPLSCCRLS
jgi:hypothetical protein